MSGTHDDEAATSQGARPPIWRRGPLRSVVSRLIALHLAMILTGAAIVLGSVFLSTTAELKGRMRAAIAEELRGLDEDYRDLRAFGLQASVQSRISIDRGGDRAYLLLSPTGSRLAGNLTRWPGELERDGRFAAAVVDLTDGRSGVRIEAVSRRLPGGERLLVGRIAETLRFFNAALERAMLIAVAVFGVLAAIGAALLSRFLRRRLKAVAATAGEIMHGDLSRRMARSGAGDEFDRLAEALNAMLDRIADLISDLRMVTDGVSHDLRSPLTRLRGHLEAALASEALDPAARGRVEQALAETDGALEAFAALIAIARAEAGMGREQFETVEISELAFALAGLYEPAAEAAGLRLNVAAARGLKARGHRQLLTQALSNLIENALKHGPAGSEIRLTVDFSAEQARISVSDAGPGIPEADRARALRRFERLDPSRGGAGFGLGLALAAAVARLHGGALELFDARPGVAPKGLEARLSWPQGDV